MRRTASVLALIAVACSDTPTVPTLPTPPPPLPSAQLEQTGQPTWVNCDPFDGSCVLNWSLQNVGPGCATQTTTVARLYDASDAQVRDVQMGAVGGLYGRTIRPQGDCAAGVANTGGSEPDQRRYGTETVSDLD